MLNQYNSSVTVPSEENLPGGLPRDIWVEIATYLSPQELQSFKLACFVHTMNLLLKLKSTPLRLQTCPH
jgi:hypothetical protein